MLVTQNIDDYHCLMVNQSKVLDKKQKKAVEGVNAFTPHVYEIHGNVFYMHCSDEEADHSRSFYRCPSLKEVGKNKKDYVPKCKECKKDMKPHCMFFDEAYSEHYYRKETVEKFIEDSDCLVVVGTALATHFAKQTVAGYLEKELPVIEINLESAINVGNNL